MRDEQFYRLNRNWTGDYLPDEFENPWFGTQRERNWSLKTHDQQMAAHRSLRYLARQSLFSEIPENWFSENVEEVEV